MSNIPTATTAPAAAPVGDTAAGAPADAVVVVPGPREPVHDILDSVTDEEARPAPDAAVGTAVDTVTNSVSDAVTEMVTETVTDMVTDTVTDAADEEVTRAGVDTGIDAVAATGHIHDVDPEEINYSSLYTVTAATRPGGLRRGNLAVLIRYWTRGEGRAKIRFGTSGDFMRCVRQLSKHVPPNQVKGFCARLHRIATGQWPGRGREH